MERGGRTMVQKKSETVPTVDDKMISTGEESQATGSFVSTFWDQYEQSRERAHMLQENREDAYINAVREVIKFNKQYRESIAKLYEQSKKTNQEIVSQLMHQFTSPKDQIKEEVKVEAEHAGDREELKKQLIEVSGQLEKLALTPVKSVINMIDQFEDNFEKNAESSVAFARERRDAWLQVRKEYVNLARDTHLNLVDRSKNSIKELIKVK